MDNNRSKQKIIASFIVIMAVVIVTFGVKWHNKHELSETGASTPTSVSASTQSTPTTSTSSTSTSASYKDGTYTAHAEYYVPHGSEDISVTLTLKDGVVTASNIKNSESDPESAQFQEDFASSYKSYVVGKNINGLNISFIAGASETSQGFNDALRQIANQAKA
jgi:uncharacterized protein with FMN-binding domain